ncbi:Crp/Fnr family transcriptional regulator [Catenuloplanes japonicus]|uniref:Crp/Fnr family transcriptional regulator n=1 Tax=Catenuloplanes japonicus TaxID=33876 RepID=UPI000524CABB|nr:Crp/Fnr family transcriptional regulator [Catenuloplanes japonicus]
MEEVASIRIVDLITADQRRELEALGTPVEFPAEHTLFWEGQPAHSALIIQRGNVKVTSAAPDGSETILAIRGSTEIMGDEGVLMSEPRSATVTTITEVGGLDIKAEDLLRFVDENGLWPLMYRAAVRRRRQSDRQMLLARSSVRSRLARWLIELAEEVGEEQGDDIVISTTLSQNDIAGRIGASRDAVAIELRRLRETGMISTGRRRIAIHDAHALREAIRTS